MISLSPNSANALVTVNYTIENSSSAYLIVTGQTNGVSNNYMLDADTTEIDIDINNYTSGNYIVTLVCNGQIVESKHLVKN